VNDMRSKKSNFDHFNLFIFISTFSRSMIEVFIPILLYKAGFSLFNVLFYYILINLFSSIICIPLTYICEKINNKVLIIISVISFLFVYIMLSHISINIYYLISLAFLYALYRRSYWIERRFYNLVVMYKTDIGKKVGKTNIVNQIAIIFAAYVGSLFLDYVTLNMLIIISSTIFLLSIIPLLKIKVDSDEQKGKINIKKAIKTIPFRDLIIYASYESINIVTFIFPLYLYLYVEEKYQIVGLFNLFCGVASILFIYLFSKYLDDTKRNYISLSALLISIVFILKLNMSSVYMVLFLAFAQGIIEKMYDVSYNKSFYELSKYVDRSSYNLIYELIENVSKVIFLPLFLLITTDLKTMLYLSILLVIVNAFVTFKNKPYDIIDIK
jgi:predicted MFS family arabinose efflux permease